MVVLSFYSYEVAINKELFEKFLYKSAFKDIMRNKQRITITLNQEQLQILEKYGFKNKSVWIGEVIEQWYLNNITEADRLDNKMKWLEMRKKEVEDEIRYLKGKIEKLEKLSQTE